MVSKQQSKCGYHCLVSSTRSPSRSGDRRAKCLLKSCLAARRFFANDPADELLQILESHRPGRKHLCVPRRAGPPPIASLSRLRECLDRCSQQHSAGLTSPCTATRRLLKATLRTPCARRRRAQAHRGRQTGDRISITSSVSLSRSPVSKNRTLIRDREELTDYEMPVWRLFIISSCPRLRKAEQAPTSVGVVIRAPAICGASAGRPSRHIDISKRWRSGCRWENRPRRSLGDKSKPCSATSRALATRFGIGSSAFYPPEQA
jgi:hypothetical protein